MYVISKVKYILEMEKGERKKGEWNFKVKVEIKVY